jgi:hypothetical protein
LHRQLNLNLRTDHAKERDAKDKVLSVNVGWQLEARTDAEQRAQPDASTGGEKNTAGLPSPRRTGAGMAYNGKAQSAGLLGAGWRCPLGGFCLSKREVIM